MLFITAILLQPQNVKTMQEGNPPYLHTINKPSLRLHELRENGESGKNIHSSSHSSLSPVTTTTRHQQPSNDMLWTSIHCLPQTVLFLFLCCYIITSIRMQSDSPIFGHHQVLDKKKVVLLTVIQFWTHFCKPQIGLPLQNMYTSCNSQHVHEYHLNM